MFITWSILSTEQTEQTEQLAELNWFSVFVPISFFVLIILINPSVLRKCFATRM